jgi:hypothetical protein
MPWVIGVVDIVVNDSLILLNLANRMRDIQADAPAIDVVVYAIKDRLRPILREWFLS